MIQNNSNVIDFPASSHIVEKKSGCYVLNVHRCECGSFSKPDLRLTALPLVQIKWDRFQLTCDLKEDRIEENEWVDFILTFQMDLIYSICF